MKDGGPAFPCTIPARFKSYDAVRGIAEVESPEQHHEGLSLRDYFAAAALQGMMGSNDSWQFYVNDGDNTWLVETRTFSEYATAAYRISDAMLAEREKGGK